MSDVYCDVMHFQSAMSRICIGPCQYITGENNVKKLGPSEHTCQKGNEYIESINNQYVEMLQYSVVENY